MKKLLSFVLALLAVTSAAQTTIVGGGGGFASGATASGCTAYSLVYVDSSGNLACALAPVNGSVSTAGRGIFSVLDTITGSSATSNFLNITGTFPATLSATTSAIYSSITFDNDASTQYGISSTVSGAPGSFSAAVSGLSANTGGYAIGLYAANTGAATRGVGVYGYSSAGTNRFGGWFGLDFAAPTGTAALVADNVAVAANIFEARDNGTAVLTVADGGLVNSTAGFVTTATAVFAPGNAQTTSGAYGFRSALTPDAPVLLTGTDSNSLHFEENADSTFDFNNGRCGTSACTSPALIIHSPDQATTEYAQISTDTTGAAGFQSNFAEIRVGGTKTAITESSAQAIIRVGIPTSTNVYGMTVFYTVYDINAANYVTRTGSVKVQGGNSGGTATCTINTTQDAEGEDGSQVATSNAATLTYTWTNVAATTNCDLSLNAASSEGTNTYAVTWTAVLTGNSSAITITGQ